MIQFRSIISIALATSSMLGSATLFAQDSNFILFEYPPYLDPPENTEVGLNKTIIRFPYNDYAGPDSPDITSLEQAYKVYQKAGYSKPPLSPKVEFIDSAKRRFGIYRFDFAALNNEKDWSNSSAGYYQSGMNCKEVDTPETGHTFINWIAINSNTSNTTRFEMAQTLAHELFHAVQDGYPLFASGCVDDVGDPPGWIGEGIADTAANMITEKRFPGRWRRQVRTDYLSSRPYRIAFQSKTDWCKDDYFSTEVVKWFSTSDKKKITKEDQVCGMEDSFSAVGYRTSGFWEFLVRRVHGSTVAEANGEKLSQMIGTWRSLFERNLPSYLNPENGWLREVEEWVETLPLKSKPSDHNLKGHALYAWLPEFFTEYATWWDKRHPQMNGQEERWLDMAYGKCQKIELRPSRNSNASTKTLEIKNLRRNSAQCFDVVLTGFSGPVDLVIQATAPSVARADQLHLGLARVEAPANSGTTVDSCWDYHNSDQTWCLRHGTVAKDPVRKTWKPEQITGSGLNLGSGVDARMTWVLSNVGLFVDTTKLIEKLELKVTATYSFGGNKQFAPPSSVQPVDQLAAAAGSFNRKETFYGLHTMRAPQPSGMFEITLNEIEAGESPRCGGEDEYEFCAYDIGGDYLVQSRNTLYGQTGMVHATVFKSGNPGLLTTWCSADADSKVVEVLESSDKALILRINADLCEAPSPMNNYCNKQLYCPVKDRLVTTITLGLGREHFAETASLHLRTPGTRYDIESYFRFGVPTSSTAPEMGSSGNTEGPSGPTEPGETGTGTTSTNSSRVFGLDSCNCSCEELNELEALGEVAKQEGDGVTLQRLSGHMMDCSSQCQTEYLMCHLRASEEKKAAEAAAAEAKAADAPVCDCTCSGIKSTQDRAMELSQLIQPGELSAIDEIKQLGRCTEVCIDQVTACMMSGSL